MSVSIEDRLRAHYADRAEREPLPGPGTEDALADLKAGHEPRLRYRSNGRRFPLRPLALAAAFLAICAAAGVFVARLEDQNRVSSGPDDRPSVDTTVPPTTTPATIPSTTAAPPATPGGQTIVASRVGLLTWWDGTRWRGEIVDGGPAEGGEDYQVVRLDDPIYRTVGGWMDSCFFDVDGAPVQTVDPGIPVPAEGPGGIAVSGVANPRPRAVAVLREVGPYQASAVEALASVTIVERDPRIAQAISGDLDGDGTEEVLAVAERISGPGGAVAAGDYSVLFIRRLVGGSLRTTVVGWDIAEGVENQQPFLETFRVSALADMNGDGRMEVAVESLYYEGLKDTIYEYDADGDLLEVGSSGCGA